MDVDKFVSQIHYFMHKFGVHLLSEDENGRINMPDGFRADIEAELAAIQSSVDLDSISIQLEQMRELMATNRKVKDWYSVDEVASIVKKARWTVRDWCREGRMHARKRTGVGRGNTEEWEIPLAALDYYRDHGLRPRSGK